VEGGVAHVGTDMVLTLTKEQVAARAHVLERVGGGYRPKAPVQFKAGEAFGLDVPPAKLPRNLAVVLVPEAKAKPTAAAAPAGSGTNPTGSGTNPPGPAGDGGGDA